ncbi:hypothetical protein [Kiloniella sp. EL199]|uniref:hypothetical protein n=1 Tax=Kiloniella sp. EL199 TaxID=2107581 RepID=UPI0013C4EF91|nr:hypothetical protein [Kiloniella sp. EL199]
MKKNVKRATSKKSGFSPRFFSRRTFFAFAAIISLCLQILVPLEQSWANPPQNPDINSEDVFVICTPSGLRVLSLNSGDDGQPIESTLDLSCPACSLASVTLAPLPVNDPVLYQTNFAITDNWIELSEISHDRPAPLPPARAPPLMVQPKKHTEVLIRPKTV